MKKRSVWILFLTATLCLAMLLSSCNPTNGDGAGTTAQTTGEPLPPQTPVDYASLIDKWNEYIACDVEETKVLTATEWFDAKTYNREDEVSCKGAFCIVTHRETTYDITYDIYNVNSGEKLLSKSIKTYDPRTGTGTRFNFVLKSEATGILETVEIKVNSMETVSNYCYYDANGKALATNLTEADYSEQSAGRCTLATIGQKVYACYEGEILCEFDKGSETDLPEITYEYGDYLYIDRYNEATDELESVIVLDKQYNKLCEYKTDAGYDNNSYWVLSNGDLLFQYESNLYDNEADGDYSVSDPNKKEYDLSQVLVNVKTGSVTKVSAPFLICSMMTPRDAEQYGLKLKGDYQLAVINQITEGKRIMKQEFVILDNTVTVKETLPCIVPNQFAIERALDDEIFVVCANTFNSAVPAVYYAVNTADKTVSLYIDEDLIDEEEKAYRLIEGGFIRDDILYSNELKELYDLRDVEEYSVYDNCVLIQDEDKISFCYIDKGEAKIKEIADSSDSVADTVEVEGDLIFVYSDSISVYSVAGDLLLSKIAGTSVTVAYTAEEHIVMRSMDSRHITYYILK